MFYNISSESKQLKEYINSWTNKYSEEFQNLNRENEGLSREFNRTLKEYRGMVYSYSNEKLNNSHIKSTIENRI